MITQTSVYLVTNNIECERLIAEEGCDLFDDVRSYSWFEPNGATNILQSLIDRQQVVHESELDKELTALRTVLTPSDIESYAKLGRHAATVLEATCKNLKRGQTELEIAGELASNCLRVGMDPVVNLVAADERVYSRRHPLPTHKAIEGYVLLALGARCRGLVASLSRLVHFGEIPEDLKRRRSAVASVDSAYIGNIEPGTPLNFIFQKGQQEYENQGYADEWENHHQGGLTGYRSREQRVNSDSEGDVRKGQAYAWNPAIQGAKSEDTILVGDSGCDILTRTGDFPETVFTVNGNKIPRPDILERRFM